MVRFEDAERPFLRRRHAGLRVALVWIGALAAILLLATVHAASADKLVIFKNGKILRVKGVDVGDLWTHLDLGKGAKMGVRTEHILGVEDSTGKGGNRASLPNQASVGGRGGSAGGGGGASRGRSFGGPRISQQGQGGEADEVDASDGREAQQRPGAGQRRPGNVRRSPNPSAARAIQEQINNQNRLRDTRSNRFGRGGSRLSNRSSFRGDEPAREDLDPEADRPQEEEGDQ